MKMEIQKVLRLINNFNAWGLGPDLISITQIPTKIIGLSTEEEKKLTQLMEDSLELQKRKQILLSKLNAFMDKDDISIIDFYISKYVNKEITLNELCGKLNIPKMDIYDLLEDKGIMIFDDLNNDQN